jgi:hypothetical protein
MTAGRHTGIIPTGLFRENDLFFYRHSVPNGTLGQDAPGMPIEKQRTDLSVGFFCLFFGNKNSHRRRIKAFETAPWDLPFAKRLSVYAFVYKTIAAADPKRKCLLRIRPKLKNIEF